MRLIAVVAVLIAGTVPQAQSKPDFSGVWTYVTSAAVPPATSAAFARTWTGDPVTIKQDATTLTVEYTSGGRAHQPVKLVYNLDGTERTNIDKNSLYPSQTSRAAWRGSTLVLTTTVTRVLNGDPDPVEVTEALTLDSPASLSIQITRKSKTLTDSAVARYRRQ